MTTPPALAENDALPPVLLREEAARYALLRRIAPAIRHHLAGTLQPMGMLAAIMERRLQAEAPDLAMLRENTKSISTLSRSAASASMNLMTWLLPKDNGVVALEAGINEALGMLTTDLAFRGFTLDNQVSAPGVTVAVFALRSVFTASLLALTDASPAPASVLLSHTPDAGRMRLRITLESAPGPVDALDAGRYRALGWDDVLALAAAESVRVVHSAKQVDMWFSEVEVPLVTG